MGVLQDNMWIILGYSAVTEKILGGSGRLDSNLYRLARGECGASKITTQLPLIHTQKVDLIALDT